MPDVATPPPRDAAPAPDAPAPVPAVTVSITDIRGARAGVRVAFHDDGGAVIETKLTGDDDKAIHAGTTPSMASALIENADGKHIVTWTGVEDGDDLRLYDDGRSYESIGTSAVTLPIYRYCAAASNRGRVRASRSRIARCRFVAYARP